MIKKSLNSNIPNNVFFVGIGGIGLSALAKLLIDLGHKVYGSDIKENGNIRGLINVGADIKIGHSSSNIISRIDAVVVSSAISSDNVEVKKAIEMGIPILHRSEMLALIVKGLHVTAVSGSHGKTTTTSLISSILEEAQLDPTIIMGGISRNIKGNAKLGGSSYAIIEADESDGSFLNYSTSIAVITNIEFEHVDHYKNLDELKKSFLSFTEKVTSDGVVVLCEDDKNCRILKKDINRNTITYGINDVGDVIARNIEYKDGVTFFDVYKVVHKDNRYEKIGECTINIIGHHNVQNALASICVAIELGIDFNTIRQGLSKWQGVDRRMQVMSTGTMSFEKQKIDEITIIQDYGHHPTEISSTIKSIKDAYNKRIVTIFQPHKYSRTKAFLTEFSVSLSRSDYLFITDIYSASEKPIDGFSITNLLNEFDVINYKNVKYFSDYKQLKVLLPDILKSGDIILILGAGDIDTISEKLSKTVENFS